MNRALDVATSIGASLARLGTAARIGELGKRPEKPIELWEFEACPFCRKVREALSILDLDAVIYPCPKGGPRFREELKARAGKAQFPYMRDPNSSKEMYESDDIVRYLFETYGDGQVPMALSLGVITNLTASLASAWRPFSGLRYEPSTPPDQPLELYSFEPSPFSRLAREALCSLEIPYVLHNVAKGSRRRDVFVERSGKMRVPYLVDPNSGVEMFESADIVSYLTETYALDAA